MFPDKLVGAVEMADDVGAVSVAQLVVGQSGDGADALPGHRSLSRATDQNHAQENGEAALPAVSSPRPLPCHHVLTVPNRGVASTAAAKSKRRPR